MKSEKTGSKVETSSTNTAEPIKAKKSWSRRLNPLKSSTIPPVPDRRQPCREQSASFVSKAIFHWITPLMHVSHTLFSVPLSSKWVQGLTDTFVDGLPTATADQ